MRVSNTEKRGQCQPEKDVFTTRISRNLHDHLNHIR